MAENKGNFFVHRPIVAMVIAIVIVIIGAVSLIGLPIEQYPDLAPPIVKVRATYTGANAISVEESVATPLEQQINGVDNMIYLKSVNSNDGTMTIDVTFDVGTDPDMNTVLTQNRVSAASAKLPSDVTKFGVTTEKSMPNFLMIIALTSDGRYDQEYPPEIPTGLPSQLLERRPDILQAEADYMQANAMIGVAVAMRFPSISLTGLLGGASSELSSFTSGGMAWSVGGSLLGPLFQFGKNKRRVEQQRYLAEASRLNYEATVIQAFKDVEDALISIETLKEELLAQERRMVAAENAEILSGERYDKGVTSYLEVLESQRQSFDAQLSYSSVRRDLLSSYIELYKALGGGWISEEEMQQAEAATVAAEDRSN